MKIEDLLALSITDLQKVGFEFRPGAENSGFVTWHRNGREVSRVYVRVDATGAVAFARFLYVVGGEQYEQTTPLVFQPSNLNRGGYYLFVCPVTGLTCRKLYLFGRRFVSRFAFRALYPSQNRPRLERSPLCRLLALRTQLDALREQPRRKEYYRGTLTRYGRRCLRLSERVSGAVDLYAATKDT